MIDHIRPIGWRARLRSALAGVPLLLLASSGAHAGPADATQIRGWIRGSVADRDTGAPIPEVDVRIVDDPHLESTGATGHFTISGVTAGVHEVQFSRIGFEPTAVAVTVAPGDTATVNVSLIPRVIQLDESRTRGRREGPLIDEADRVVQLSGKSLLEKLGSTVAATLSSEPGVAERSMGPAPARPVVRGMSGERLLVLEDGAPTGDLSSTSPDHAVVIDPLSVERVEVVRGPAAFEFGSSVLGGVVNVDRSYVPSVPLAEAHGHLQTHGESVSRSRAFQGEIGVPWGEQTIQASVSARRAEDVDTPVGSVENTAIESWNGSIGATRFGDWGRVGVAGSYFDTRYGVPGGFLGGHPHGADIVANRRYASMRAELLPDWTGVPRVRIQSTYSRYYQEELESNGSCGVSFGVLSYDAQTRVDLDEDAPGPITSGSLGLDFRRRNYASGCFSFTPPTIERSSGAFLYQRAGLGAWEFGGSLRVDGRVVEPESRLVNKAGVIRKRSFLGWSGALSVDRDVAENLTAEVVLLRSFRSPSLEELFSDGPHLAAFTYEVGNADLGTESGLGIESTVRWGDKSSGDADVRLTAYANEVHGYIHAVDTGEIEYGSGEDGSLARWQFRGEGVRITGFETSAGVHLGRYDLRTTASYVRGTRKSDGAPLPLMPPLSGQLEATGRWQRVEASVTARGAAAQERLGEFEEATAAYLVWDAGVTWSHLGADQLHEVIFRLQNAGDAVYRNHLSRIKSILPEPGRSFSLVYRMSF